ncbi:MAG: hypothetical protein E7417_02390 [Ruminococcaceae bacterium]|nr:hypothetical protein [Oscillospiraceae bacterium]
MAKETIYTIPINEAFEKDTECPLCDIRKRLEAEAVEYALGPAMMEPDHRELSNEKGYCNHHYRMLFKAENKLPLALVLDTHLEELRKKIEPMKSPQKKLLFKKQTNSSSSFAESCLVCDKINHTMSRYVKNLIDMWHSDEDFRKKVANSKGFCIPHFQLLYDSSDDAEFKKALAEKEYAELCRIQEDIHKFTLKFDYRNRDMEWGTAKDAPLRTTEKIGSYITEE